MVHREQDEDESSCTNRESVNIIMQHLSCTECNSNYISVIRIAASNIEIEKTDVSATTLHNMFELDGDYLTKLDFGKTTSPKVAELIAMEVLLIDEFSMLDKKCFEGIYEILSILDHSRRPGVASPDP